MKNFSCYTNSATIYKRTNNSKLITKIISFFCVLLMVVTYQPMAVFAEETISNQSEKTEIYAIESNDIKDQTNKFNINQNNYIVNENDDQVGKVIAGGVAGGVVGGVASIAMVSAAGTAGLSAAGISSGLATMGGLIGGGMAAGLAVSAALPVLAMAGTGFAIYEAVKSFTPKKDTRQNDLKIEQNVTIYNNN
ncbi:hypothetical protein A5482_016040 (plasmid) [Cyanobacterium sp. IPPAS B-1200]|uniref:hypothetical protein n=1 Tax=Cyanobacterium sp. IPPAS B-1200 TaxID=1562720 RepID=UPI000852538A|nr:hypothetical protein [Cyanobacterium sp. IPPAS B-1200]